MKFEKYQASGNNFILIEDEIDTKSIKRLCDYNYGIGGDGLILINNNDISFFNKDGSNASLCINGLRCCALYLLKKGVLKDSLEVSTVSGKYNFEVLNHNKYEFKITYPSNKNFINKLTLKTKKLSIYERNYEFYFVNLGNNHAICFLDNFKNIHRDIKLIKRHIDSDKYNINFVKINSPKLITVLTYERGVGFTLSCGSGSTASAFLACKLNLIENEVRINVPFSKLKIILDKKIEVLGDANFIYRGEVDEF